MELNERLADLSLSVKETNLISLHYDEEDRKVLNGYTFLDTIGRGSYSKVKLSVKEGKYFAVKVINKYLLKKKRKGYGKNEEGYMTIISMLPDALNEIQVLKFIHEKGGHKNIIKLIEIINDEEKEKIYLILEFCSKGAIINFKEREQKFYLSEGKPYTEDKIKSFIRDLAQGLKFCKYNKYEIIKISLYLESCS
jgi:serine/threonine protein kinase